MNQICWLTDEWVFPPSRNEFACLSLRNNSENFGDKYFGKSKVCVSNIKRIIKINKSTNCDEQHDLLKK